MEAAVLKCPMCGASASKDTTCCAHCGARLATVACPSCFGMLFLGSKFCPHCGARASRTAGPEIGNAVCPRCSTGLESARIGDMPLNECPRCSGVWLTTDALQQICSDPNRHAAILGPPGEVVENAGLETRVRYLPCPVCRKLMNRVNFAQCSSVIVDVCRAHGTWFDRDELRRIVEFIRAGGLEKAKSREIAALEEERRRLKRVVQAERLGNTYRCDSDCSGLPDGLRAAASLLRGFLD